MSNNNLIIVKENKPERTSGANISCWFDEAPEIKFSPLNQNTSADVVVVGGGIAGVTTAYQLSKNNFSVILIEDGNIGSGETGRTTAHISNALDDRYFRIEKSFDNETSRLAAESHTEAINFIERIVIENNIICNFERVNGYLMLHPSDDEESLREELNAAKRAGLHVELIETAPDIIAAGNKFLKFPNQGQFHPLKYLSGLCKIILNNKGFIYTDTHVKEINNKGVETSNGYKVNAKYVVVATNSPINDVVKIHNKQAPYRTYVVAARVPKNSISHSLWWDTGNHKSTWQVYPYHYVRIHPYSSEFDLLIVGGEDHKTGQADEENISGEERFAALKNWAKNHFPIMEEVLFRWSGQVMEPVDHLGLIGRNPDDENIFIATGDSGNGITHGTIAGILISDLIAGKKNKWEEIYNPSRISLSAAGTYLQENLNVAKQYVDFITPGDIDSLKELKNGEGAIIRDELWKAAVYRDETGKLHIFSAVCPHLKCIVNWNNTEKSFDCPCHGSRFSTLGRVINGPANVDLERIEISE